MAFCPKCGKENPDDARFCMHCGADLSEYKVEGAPEVEVAPKISVSAKAEGGVALKWKPEPEKYVEIEGKKLPVFKKETLVQLDGKLFCPLCRNYACLQIFFSHLGGKWWGYNDSLRAGLKQIDMLHDPSRDYVLCRCLACGKEFSVE